MSTKEISRLVVLICIVIWMFWYANKKRKK